MNKLVRPFLALLSALTSAAVTSAQIREGECWEYRGKMGNDIEIGITLFLQESKLRASYFYKKYLKDISLSGQYAGGRELTLEERDSSANVQGLFRLRFMETDPDLKSDKPLDVDVLRGGWTRADRKTIFPVRLRLAYSCISLLGGRYAYAGATSDELVEKNAQGFYLAVLRGDKEEVANYVSFPLSFSINNKSKTVFNRAAFLRYYDDIFIKNFLEKLLKEHPITCFRIGKAS